MFRSMCNFHTLSFVFRVGSKVSDMKGRGVTCLFARTPSSESVSRWGRRWFVNHRANVVHVLGHVNMVV